MNHGSTLWSPGLKVQEFLDFRVLLFYLELARKTSARLGGP